MQGPKAATENFGVTKNWWKIYKD